MAHVFVETNWLFAYAAPAHHQEAEAVELLERAERGEFLLHVPNVCIGEARQAIRRKCQPRNEADALRAFLRRSTSERISAGDGAATLTILDKFESAIKRDLDNVGSRLREITRLPHVHVFALSDAMLDRSTELVLAGIDLKPFDQAILAAVLVQAEDLWNSGERLLSFCEKDRDLWPWEPRTDEARRELRALYDAAHLWVYQDFTLTEPARPADVE